MMWRIAILFAVLAAGCRTDPNVPILERELRLQEDKIYQLEEQLAEHRSALQAARAEPVPARPVAAPAGPPRAAGSPPPPVPAEVAGPALKPGNSADAMVPQPPIVELPTGPPQSEMPETLRSPKGPAQPKRVPPLQLPDEGPPPMERPKLPAATTPHGESARSVPPAPHTWHKAAKAAQSVEHAQAAAPSDDFGPVHRITLNPALSGGLNTDGKPGDEGLALFIEPQNHHGQSVVRPAPVSVVVLDRQARGDAARVARWDFTHEQVAQRLRRTSVGSGILLELPWPAQPPAHADLQVFVRYAAAETQQFEAELPVTIELPGQARQWTAAPPGSTKKTVSAPPPAAPVADRPATDRAPPGPSRPARERRRSEVRRPVWSPNR